MHISTPLITAALAVAVAAHSTKEAALQRIGKRDTRVWRFGNRLVGSPIHRRDIDPDAFFGTPKITPKVFLANSSFVPPEVLNTTKTFKESDHFRVYDALSEDQATKTLAMMEAAYDCFVNDFKFRTTGLSYKQKKDEGYSGPFYKENIFGKPQSVLGCSGDICTEGVMNTDYDAGLSFLQVEDQYVNFPNVTVHEFGHALTYHEENWVEQGNTGTFWEPIAEWFADTYMTSDFCAAARARGNQTTANQIGTTLIDFRIIIDPQQVIIDGTPDVGNYYEQWPLFTYMTNNPDNIEGLGKFTVRNLMRKFKIGSDETPLHAIAYLTKTPVREIIAKYWARMAFVDFGHPQAQAVFNKYRYRPGNKLNYTNLDFDKSTGLYKPKPTRKPLYFGANLIPLKATGTSVGVEITAQKPFIATLAVKKGALVTYVPCPGGACTASISNDTMLVIVNAPLELIKYNGFNFNGTGVTVGLDYELKLTGATA